MVNRAEKNDVMLLVLIRIAGSGDLFLDSHFHHAVHARLRSSAEDAHRQLPTRKVCLHQDGLAKTLQ